MYSESRQADGRTCSRAGEKAKNEIGTYIFFLAITSHFVYSILQLILTVFHESERCLWETWMHLTYFLRRSDLQGEEEKENKESVGRRKEDVRQDLLERVEVGIMQLKEEEEWNHDKRVWVPSETAGWHLQRADAIDIHTSVRQTMSNMRS